MVSRRWLFTLTMCFSPTAYLSCAFSLLLLFFRAQQFLNSFVRVPLVPFIQTRLVPSWSLPDYCTLPVEGRVKKTPGPYQHFTRDLNARSARHVQLFFFLSLLFSSLSSSCGSLSHLNTGALYWNSKRRVWAIVLGRSCSPSPFSSLSDEKHLFFFLKSWQTCHIICLSSLVHPFIEAQQKKKQNKTMESPSVIAVVVFPRKVACNLTIIFVYEPEISSGHSSVVLFFSSSFKCNKYLIRNGFGELPNNSDAAPLKWFQSPTD